MKRILSIDGGGMRGLLPCAMLVKLEKEYGRQCFEIFDSMWGTSIGGIIVLLLAAGMPAAEIMKFFTEDGPRIFKRSWYTMGPLWLLTGTKYPSNRVTEILQERFKGHESVRTRVSVTSLDTASKRPYYFHYLPGYRGPLHHAARATMAAQTYFHGYPMTVGGQPRVFWDGGNVVNNPAMLALGEAEALGWNGRKILSLGCGSTVPEFNAAKAVRPSLPLTAQISIEMPFQTGCDEVDYEAHQFLRYNYVRLQPTVGDGLPLDGASPDDIWNLKDAAANFIREDWCRVERFMA